MKGIFLPNEVVQHQVGTINVGPPERLASLI